ncbi:gas vesicle protein [Streptomyces sp. NPDC006553]|uniref:gas vesicle protein GvpO n=1 Tax=unclassified Streptomyces TaxID=2593676 RepID=UPI002256AECF|nr:gas vesicle protein [Streptomyces sp. NBC_00233]MCX5232768.1 gas vesicle protein [Streptomyces sp. NBC_00233]
MAAAEPTRPRRVRPRPAEDAEEQKRPSARRASAKRPSGALDATSAMRSAAGQLAQLLGRPPDSVSSLKPTEDGWEAQVEVVELERIPDTTSVMASYKVALDPEGQLVSYERTRRYSRGMIDRPT